MSTTEGVCELGYLGLQTADLEGWSAFGTEVLGLAVAAHSRPDRLHLKMDAYPHRLSLQHGERDGLSHAGWRVRSQEAFDTVCERLAREGFAMTPATEDELADRRVAQMAWCSDPSGFRVEIFHTVIADHARFVSPVGVSRFVTGDMGLGHIVLLCRDFEGSLDFYRSLLGFRLSDQMVLDGMNLRFLRCNARHHSLALAPHHTSRLAHLMLETSSLDEVGFCIDRCEAHGVELATTLGRHTNDRMLSFYMRAPRGYEVEFGCGGLRVDEQTWRTQEITAVSDWGHRRQK